MDNQLRLYCSTYLHMVQGKVNGKRVLLFCEATPNDFGKVYELFNAGYELFLAARGGCKAKVLH